MERAGLIPDEVERVAADEVIRALTRLCIKHAELDHIVLDFLDHLGDLALSAFSVSGLIQ